MAYLTAKRPADVRKMEWAHIEEGYLKVVRNKTGTKSRIAIKGRLKQVLDRIRKHGVPGRTILTDPTGQPLKPDGHLRIEFDKARDAAEAEAKELGIPFVRFQLRDLRAKGATDLEDRQKAQAILGHTNPSTTDRYIRQRRGDVVDPLDPDMDPDAEQDG